MIARLRPSILVFGDSITQLGYSESGWVAALSHHYSRKADIINRGFAGYNTRLGKLLAQEVFVPGSEHLFATIWFGANDAASVHGHPIEVTKPHQHVPLPEYETNLASIITTARRAVRPDGAIIVLTPPPLDRLRWPDRCNAEAHKYSQAAAKVVSAASSDSGCPVLLVDVYSLLLGSAGVAAAQEQPETHEGQALPSWVAQLNDGLHFGPEGNAAVSQALFKAIPSHLQPDSLPLDYPIWRDLPVEGQPQVDALSPQALAVVRSTPAPLVR